MIGHGCPGGGHHALGIDAAFLRDGMLQRSVAIRAVAIDLELIDGYRKLMQGKRSHAAGREIVLRTALGLCPQHVIGMSMSHRLGAGGFCRALRLQYKYTGKPASRITSPIAEFAGKVATVVITMAAQASTKRPVV